MGVHLPVSAIDLLAASSWLEESQTKPLKEAEANQFIQTIITLRNLLKHNTHRIAQVPLNQQPTRTQYETFARHLTRFYQRYQSTPCAEEALTPCFQYLRQHKQIQIT